MIIRCNNDAIRMGGVGSWNMETCEEFKLISQKWQIPFPLIDRWLSSTPVRQLFWHKKRDHFVHLQFSTWHSLCSPFRLSKVIITRNVSICVCESETEYQRQQKQLRTQKKIKDEIELREDTDKKRKISRTVRRGKRVWEIANWVSCKANNVNGWTFLNEFLIYLRKYLHKFGSPWASKSNKNFCRPRSCQNEFTFKTLQS